VRDGIRRLRAGLWVAVAAGVAAAVSPAVVLPALPQPVAVAGGGQRAAAAATRAGTARPGQAGAAAVRKYQSVLAGLGSTPATATAGGAVAEATAARQLSGQSATTAAQNAGILLPGGAAAAVTVPAGAPSAQAGIPALGKLGALVPADLLVVAPASLPASVIAKVRGLRGVNSVGLLDAARIKVNGGYVATLGVNPSTFREFAARPTARATALWQNVAGGGIAISYLMGQQEKIPLGGQVTVAAASVRTLPVAGFGTVGIGGVDAVVSDAVARSLGMPAGNAIVISAPDAELSKLMKRLKAVLPASAAIAPLVTQAPERGLPVTAGSAGAVGVTAADGPGLTVAQTRAFLTAALSRVGLPYVWGGDGPNVFDCSGLVQWSMRQAGIVMPRVAASQAQTGPRIELSELQPGDLLFYHTDPTAPQYISHVAIYLGDGLMLHAPEPGMDVQVVPAIFGQGFAGAVRVYPRVAAYVAGNAAG
jgi:cell wall-associated NlpC family hydrolase